MLNTSLGQCPYADWEKSARSSCIPLERFHCLKDEFERNGWICIDPIWIESGRCPVFNSGAKKLDSIRCNGDDCPLKSYRSNEIYIKKACQWHYPSSGKKNETEKSSSPGTDVGEASHLGLYIAIGVAIPLILVLVAGIVFLIKRNKQSTNKQDDEESGAILPLMGTPVDTIPAALNCLDTNRFVVLKGISGSGKTYVAKNIAESIEGKNRLQTKWVNDTDEIKHLSFKSKKMMLILDDIFYELQPKAEVNTTISIVNDLISTVRNSKDLYVIVTVPSYVLNKHSESLNEDDFLNSIVDLDTLSKAEREDILNHHLKKNCIKDEENALSGELYMRNRVKSTIVDTAKCDLIGYPSCIAWICKARKQFDLNLANTFLSCPITRIKSEIHRLRDSDKLQERKMFFSLAVMALCGGTLNVENIDERMIQCLATILFPKDEVTEFYLKKDDHSLSSLETKYIRKEADGNYRFQLNIVRKLVFVIVFENNTETITEFKEYVSENLWKRLTVQREKFPKDLSQHSTFFVKV
ncbi:uncharacterized protein LOC133184871 [Saccostrea echinata]|uniref:uncharacterized protein LOC133184871 n=1 Tax=Saccostrea echinata TaxID=191078 RepID=UPI002A82A453|nr:uncharacterized protein LOC133184871 [Saccostrea echinata]